MMNVPPQSILSLLSGPELWAIPVSVPFFFYIHMHFSQYRGFHLAFSLTPLILTTLLLLGLVLVLNAGISIFFI